MGAAAGWQQPAPRTAERDRCEHELGKSQKFDKTKLFQKRKIYYGNGKRAGSTQGPPAEAVGDDYVVGDEDILWDEDGEGMASRHLTLLEVKERVKAVIPDMNHILGDLRDEVDVWVRALRESKIALLLHERGLVTLEDSVGSLERVFDIGKRRLVKIQVAHHEGWEVANMIPDEGVEDSIIAGKDFHAIAKAARKEAAVYRRVKPVEAPRFQPYESGNKGENSEQAPRAAGERRGLARSHANAEFTCWTCNQKGHSQKYCPAREGAVQDAAQ